jgi:hypothetical protein
MYKCYCCGIKESSLQSIIEHCKLSHGEETLQYRQLVLDENTGIQRYQTKIHEGVVPSNLTKYGKCITVNDGLTYIAEFLKFVGPIGPRGQKIMRSANNVGNAGPHVRQTFLNDVFTFLTEVGNAGRIVNTRTSSVNSEFVTALNT